MSGVIHFSAKALSTDWCNSTTKPLSTLMQSCGVIQFNLLKHLLDNRPITKTKRRMWKDRSKRSKGKCEDGLTDQSTCDNPFAFVTLMCSLNIYLLAMKPLSVDIHHKDSTNTYAEGVATLKAEVKFRFYQSREVTNQGCYILRTTAQTFSATVSTSGLITS